MKGRKLLVGSLCLAACTVARATVLTFDGFEDIDIVPQTYGDRVVDFGTSYGAQGGATPNVVVEYVPVSNATPLTNWSSGYASLVNALGSTEFDTKGYVALLPDPGYAVVLHGFDVAAWEEESFPESRIFVRDAAGPILYDTDYFTFEPGIVLHFPPNPLLSSSGLEIHVEDFGDLGIDNIVFSQVAVIPEPTPGVLWIAGLGILGAAACRSKLARARQAGGHAAAV